MTERKGNLAAMKTVGPQHELFIVTEGATVIRVKTDEISQTGRATQGVKLMTLNEGESIQDISIVIPDDEDEEAPAETEDAGAGEVSGEMETPAEE